MARRAGPALVALVLAASASAPARAQDELPAGRFGVITALRQNVGALGDAYGFGFLFGIEAGYQPGAEDAWSVGVAWSALVRGWYFADDETLVEQSIGATEMSFALRVRRALGSTAPRFVVLNTGATFLRTTDPVPPDQEQIYLGPHAGVGIEEFVLGSGFVGLEARYGLFSGGPRSLTLVLSFTGGK